MPEDTTTPDRPLARRHLIRGGAVLAGVAGAAVVDAALTPNIAQAANGSAVTIGAANSGTSPTALTITTGTSPALTLTNAGGPVLEFNALPFAWEEPLELGQLANTEGGPRMGVDYGDGVESTYLATGIDLFDQPAPYAFTPIRYMDTRDADYRSTIIGGSSSKPFDSSGRLKAKSYIDIGIAEVDTSDPMSAVFLNLTAVKPSAGGYLSAYPSGFAKPASSSLNFLPKLTVANAGFVAVAVLDGYYAIRVYVSSASHLIVDLTGVVYGGDPADPEQQAAARHGLGVSHARRAVARRPVVGKRARTR